MSRAPIERRTVTRVTGHGDARLVERRPDDLIVEEPMSILLDGALVSTTMRTPGHDAELAVGFCLSEGLLAGAPVTGVRAFAQGDDASTGTGAAETTAVDVETEGRAPIPTPRLGNVSSSCGWCGSEHIDEMYGRLAPLVASEPFDLDVLGSVAERALGAQGLFAATGAVHAAVVFDRAGSILLTREDVGRHNAVDKVVGALVLGVDDIAGLPATGFGLFVSGRASIEMVQKAWAAGFSAVVSMSAPTVLAVDAARRANLSLAGFVRDDGFNVYAPE